MVEPTGAPSRPATGGLWPSLPADTWPATRATLHMWTQVVGKLRLALSPPQNHFWHSTLYVSARGLTTSPIPYGAETFEIDFDFVDHRLQIRTSWRPGRSVVLEPKSVADFYTEVMSALHELDIQVAIWTHPVEIPDPIPFEEDRVHTAYDAAAAHAFWRALMQADRVFKEFRGRFLGKSSPVHFFWGGFDLAVTRFSGRRAPMWSGPVLNVHPHVMHESYSHEVSSAGFWAGDATTPSIFYSYAVPGPPGFPEAAVRPSAAAYSPAMGEFLLPYESVRTADRPDESLHEFLQSTYSAAADLGKWDRPLLEESPTCLCDLHGRPLRRFP
jgi:Family of unknown function (DUF5996)